LYQITAASKSLTRGLPLPDPRSLYPLSSTEFVETPTPEQNSGVRHCSPAHELFRAYRQTDRQTDREILIGVTRWHEGASNLWHLQPSKFRWLKGHTWMCVRANKYRTRAIAKSRTAVQHRNVVKLDQHELYS